MIFMTFFIKKDEVWMRKIKIFEIPSDSTCDSGPQGLSLLELSETSIARLDHLGFSYLGISSMGDQIWSQKMEKSFFYSGEIHGFVPLKGGHFLFLTSLPYLPGLNGQ